MDEQCEYVPEKVAEYAIKKGFASRIGYLAECTLRAARNIEAEKRVNLTKKAARVEKLIEFLFCNRNKDYKFLYPWSKYKDDDFGRRMKSYVRGESKSKLNRKWKVYNYGTVSDIEEYIELYLVDLRQGKIVRESTEVMRQRRDE